MVGRGWVAVVGGLVCWSLNRNSARAAMCADWLMKLGMSRTEQLKTVPLSRAPSKLHAQGTTLSNQKQLRYPGRSVAPQNAW